MGALKEARISWRSTIHATIKSAQSATILSSFNLMEVSQRYRWTAFFKSCLNPLTAGTENGQRKT